MSARSSNKSSPVSASLRGALVMGVFAALGAGLVAGTYQLTHSRIAKNEREQLLQGLHEILVHSEYDNDILADTVRVTAPSIGGTDGTMLVHRARKNGQPVAVVMEVTAPAGYSGAIRMLVGIYLNGEIAGVRVVAHRETPGLGDDIDLSRSDWILQFRRKSLDEPAIDAWPVKRDGGACDQFTGATITPRAVVNAVRNALVYFREHKDQLFLDKGR